MPGPKKGAPNAGRPKGTGARTITITRHNQRGTLSGYMLFIGRALWQAIGEPECVTLDCYRTLTTIHACSPEWRYAHRVQGARQNTIPRFVIGEEQLAKAELTIGIYHATVHAGMEIRISKAERDRVLYATP